MVMGTLALVLASGGEGGMSPFQPNFGLTLWTWVVFVLLLFALQKFAFPSILKLTEERERTIATQLSEAERMQREATAALEENKRLLAESRAQASQLLNDARSAAEKERAAAVEKTKAEQAEALERARREIAAERERAIEELRREAVEISLVAASKLVDARLDAEADRKLVTDYLATLEVRR